MNGSDSSAGLEPADTSRANDHPTGSRDALRLLATAEAILEANHEYKAAGEVRDALGRLRVIEEASAARERQRRSESVDGKDPQEAEVRPIS